jgi:hypothetical protein
MRVWEVTDAKDHHHVGLFYGDYFARAGKRSGAWETEYRSREKFDGPITPLVSNNNNFVKGAPGEPVLISLDDAETLFHEFGHALHEFLSDVTNRRDDVYGGSPQNRARLTAEVVEAVVDEIGAGRVGLRISPGNGAGDMREVDEVEAYEALLNRIGPLGLAYLHLLIEPTQPAFAVVRSLWEGTLVLNTPREIETNFCELENLVEWGVIGAAAVGRGFLANPDLVDRLTRGAELNDPDAATFYSSGPVGYIDYPTLRRIPKDSAFWFGQVAQTNGECL